MVQGPTDLGKTVWNEKEREKKGKINSREKPSVLTLTNQKELSLNMARDKDLISLSGEIT